MTPAQREDLKQRLIRASANARLVMVMIKGRHALESFQSVAATLIALTDEALDLTDAERKAIQDEADFLATNLLDEATAPSGT